MLYAAKCYWPGVTRTDLQQVSDRAGAGPGTPNSSVIYLGSLLFAADDLVLCLFCGPTRAAVIQASDRLASRPNASWNPSGSPRPAQPRKERRHDQTPQHGRPGQRPPHPATQQEDPASSWPEGHAACQPGPTGPGAVG
jgi:hypothetical protein